MKHGLITLLLALSFEISSATKARVTMPDKLTIEGKELLLNGLGIRQATWLRVKVYVGGVYLPTKSHDPKAIMSMPFPKFINMSFVRDVSGKKLVDGWEEAYQKVHGDKKSEFKKESDQFNKTMEDVRKGDQIRLTFLEEGLKVNIKNKDKAFIKAKGFSKFLFALWFQNPVDTRLLEGLLGK